MKKRLFLAIGLASMLCHFPASATIPWKGDDPFFLSSRGSKLTDVLHDLGANYGVPVVVSEKVDEPFIGVIRDVSPTKALDELARMHKLAWYYDGQAVHVYKANEVGSKLITPTYLPVSELIDQLEGSHILDNKHCRVRALPSSNAMQVEGVPICLTRVNTLAERIDQQKLNHDQNQEKIELFPLKYASAGDTKHSYRGQEIVIPGIVSMLKEMAQGRTLPLKENQGAQQPADRSLPMFSADIQQNAVIVRDRKINIPMYATLIKKFDIKPKLIEISVMIMDVDSTELNSLGIDWSLSTQIGGGGISLNSNGAPSSSSFSSIISNTGGFMVKLSALEENAKAQVLSRPSVVTLDNTEAVLDRSVTFHTKLISDKVAKLESITTGSMLRVTPRLINQNGHPEMMLKLIIQDGTQTESHNVNEPLPQTRNSEVSTQTLLRAGQSLLLGGFIQDEVRENERKIPLLGDLPLVGKLFRSTNKTSRSTVRLFLIKAQPSSQL